MTVLVLASVVIPTCNRAQELAACLALVERAIVVAGHAGVEVVVSDDGGDPSQLADLRRSRPGVRWVEGPRRGPGANRNAGVAAASGTWILFLDDDCRPEPGWIAAYLAAVATSPHATVFEGRTVSDRDPRRFDEDAPVNLTGGVLWTCNMAIAREAFVALGGFDERYAVANEDCDLRLRLAKAGHATVFVAAATVCHPMRRSKALAFHVRAGRDLVRLHERHPEQFGGAPLRTVATNLARVGCALLRDLPRFGVRGLGYALARWTIWGSFYVLAAIRRAAAR